MNTTMLTNEDIARLDEHFDTRYRKVDACDERHSHLEDKLDKINTAVANMGEKVTVLVTKTSISNKWLGAIATAAIGGLITLIITRIF